MGIKHSVSVVHGQTGQASDWNADHVFDSNYNCDQFEALNFVHETRAAPPAGPNIGQVYYDTGGNILKYWNNTIWRPFSPAFTAIVADDGSGDYDDIQDGIDSLPASGGIVYIKEGTYLISAALTFPNDNITLAGSGPSTVIVSTLQISKIDISSKNGIVVRDLSIDGQNIVGANNIGISGDVGTDCKIFNTFIYDCTYCIRISGSGDRTHIHHNSIHGFSAAGIMCLTPQSFNSISYNSVYSGSGYGIYIHSTSDEVDISHNHIYSLIGVGIQAVLCGRCRLICNTIYDCTSYGLYFTQQDNTDNNAIISENDIRLCNTGMYIDAGGGGGAIGGPLLLNNNVIQACLGSGILICLPALEASYHLSIVGNAIANCGSHGISVGNCGPISYYFVITSNKIMDNGGDGINLAGQCNEFLIGTNQTYNNTGWGINIANVACNANFVHANYNLANGAGAIQDNGVGTILSDNQ